ncbi:MAG: transglycosylase domain-containing protein [Myxococcota bacterium]|nr:transglycosylase domain-containing protein [Myxococcota bacterium]
MSPGRKTAIAAGVASGLIGVGALGAWLAAPGIVREEAIARANARGLRCTIAETRVGFDELVLRGVELRDASGAIDARLEEVALDAGVFALAARGGEAIGAIVVRGGEIRVNTSVPGLAASVARLRGDAPTEAPTVSPSAVVRRVLRLEAVAAVLSDDVGELASTESFDATIGAGRISIVARELTIAAGSADSTRVEELTVEGSLDDREITLLRGRSVLVQVADAADELGVLARARAARAAVLGGSGGAAESPDEERGPFGLLGDSFVGRIDALTVRRRTPEGARDVLTELAIDVTREGADVFRTRGDGRPDHGGRLGWDLRVEPMALRAEGSVVLEGVAVAVVEPLLPAALPLHRPEDARLDAELRIEGQGDALHATGRLAVRDLALAAERIAPAPISGIALGLEGQATFRPDQRRLEIERLRVESGAAHLDVAGVIEWAPEHYLFDLAATLPTTRCGDAIAAIPRDLLQEMATFSFSGEIGGRLEAHVDSRDLDATTLTIRVADGCRFEMVPPLADLGRFESPFVHRVEEPDGATFEMTTGPGSESWTAISEISPFMVHAVLGHEDAGFFRHAGFSTGSIRGALVRNLRAGRYVMGASTISMQLVKNVFLRREKTLARKVQEVLLTWWMESAWSKEQILELYLNVIEYGPGVYGIRNAAAHYFGVEPIDLSPVQAAYLATILPNPKAYHSHWVQGALPSSWVARLSRFARVLGERGRFDAEAVDEAIREIAVFRFRREGEPMFAPRVFRGRTSPLPIGGAADDAGEVIWDEALDGMVAESEDGEYE